MGNEPDQVKFYTGTMSKVIRNITQSKILSVSLLKPAKRVTARAVLLLRAASRVTFFFYKNISFEEYNGVQIGPSGAD